MTFPEWAHTTAFAYMVDPWDVGSQRPGSATPLDGDDFNTPRSVKERVESFLALYRAARSVEADFRAQT